MSGLLSQENRRALARGLLDTTQAASNSAASTVSAPVDALAWLLRKAGAPIPQAPLGGSDWMRSQGLMRDVQSPVANVVGESIGNVLPIVAAAKAPQIAGGLLKAAENASAKAPMNAATRNQAGAIVWHGSPHKFDRFDASKIGTGEGAQAYGHGLYLAERKGIAEGYRDKLSHGRYQFEGRPMDALPAVSDSPERSIAERFLTATNHEGKTPIQALADIRAAAANQVAVTQKHYADAMRLNGKTVDMGADWGNLRKFTYNDSVVADTKRGVEYANKFKSIADALTPDSVKAIEGQLYKIDLPDDQIAKMLDWDKPLSQQPWVMSRVSPLLEDSKVSQDAIRQLLGRDVIAQDGPLAAYAGPNRNAKMFSEILRQEKIPGIRYLDGGSRGTGSGTSNFVAFPGNEGLLNILERNGKPIR